MSGLTRNEGISVGNAARSQWTPPVAIVPHRDESLGGLLIRFCVKNGWPTLPDFALRLGMAPIGFRWGKDVDRIAVALGVETAVLSPLVRVRSNNTAQIAGEAVSLGRIELARRRVCSSCLQADGYQKAWWELAFLTVCPVHCEELVSTCSCGGALAWRDPCLTHCVECDGSGTRSLAAGKAATLMPFQRWCLKHFGILDDAEACPVLDALPFNRSIDLVEMAALLDLEGFGGYVPALEDQGCSVEMVRERGFELLLRGQFGDVVARTARQFIRRTGVPAEDAHFVPRLVRRLGRRARIASYAPAHPTRTSRTGGGARLSVVRSGAVQGYPVTCPGQQVATVRGRRSGNFQTGRVAGTRRRRHPFRIVGTGMAADDIPRQKLA